uniref:Senataxin n=1 Tax=Leptobrachium leishanense TaxID=445787 RepID=A0A8C5R0I1_9ANUR
MSTCRWCTPSGSNTADLLTKYAAGELCFEDLHGANDDLSYCMECVLEYHRARDGVPQLHKTLWKLETIRVIAQLEKSMREEIDEEDELFFVDGDEEKQIFGYTNPNFESNVRVPLLESLKYPYLLLSQQVSELCVEALCKMEQVNNPFQVFDKLSGVYLLLVHPNEIVRRWAIGTARAQGKVERDDYYDLQDVFTCLFKVIELGLFENPDLYSTELEEGKLILLPSHLYDTSNYKNYWLGICMLLTVLEEQAMDSLLLGPDKQNDFMQSILYVMEKYTEDENLNAFWPALHCFMMILDRLGSKVWGQLIDPIQAFQAIISSPSYRNEIETVRASCRSKSEPETSDHDDLISCSQMVYSFDTEKKKKDTGWKNAICPDYCPNMYEEMQCLTNILQSDIGQDMRVHDSAFLWFVPYVQSVMDLKDLGVAYIMEVIHHLYSEIKDVFSPGTHCDKVTELFVLVLVSIIELHRNKKCLHLLWVSSHKWVEALVKSALLPTKDQHLRSNPRLAASAFLSSSPTSQSGSSVQFACMLLIRSLLREGIQLGQQAACKQYLDKLNLVFRANACRNLELSKAEAHGLQACLTQIIKNIKDKASANPSSPTEPTTSKTQSLPFIKNERIDEDDDAYYGSGCCSPLPPIDSKHCPAGISATNKVLPLKIKTEPPGSSMSDWVNAPTSECSPSTSVHVKEELFDSSGPSSAAQTKEKKKLFDWQSKLSKVMAKVHPKSKTAITDCKQNTDCSASEDCPDESKKTQLLDAPVKNEPCDQWFTRLDSVDSPTGSPQSGLKRKLKVESSDASPVVGQMKKLSLESKNTESTSDYLMKEYPLEQDSKAVVKSDLMWMNGFESPNKGRSSSTGIDGKLSSETEEDDDVPLTLVRKRLLKRSPLHSSQSNSKLDRDLDYLSLAAQAKCLTFPSEEAPPEPSQIERRVRGAVRSSLVESSSDSKLSLTEIITISDSSSDDEIKPFINLMMKTEPKEGVPSTSAPSASLPKTVDKIKTESPTFDEYGSQMFEFETEDDVYSAWEDFQVDQKVSSPERPKQVAISSPERPKQVAISSPEKSKQENAALDLHDDYDQWGYDTDFIFNDVAEEAKDEKKSFQTSPSSPPKDPVGKKSTDKQSVKGITSKQFYKPLQAPVATGKMATVEKERSQSPKKPRSKRNEAASASHKTVKPKANRTKSPLKAHGDNVKYSSSRVPSLAVVPPKKTRVCAEPTSVAEKLHLKRVPRVAFDLSQRSLDSLTELQKTKLISPKSLFVKGNRKLLACQDRQFYMQSRQKESSKGKLAEASEDRGTRVDGSKRTGNKHDNDAHVSGRHKHHQRKKLKERPNFASDVNGDATDVNDVINGTLKGRLMQSFSVNDIVSPGNETSGKKEVTEDDDDDDDFPLTQADPIDMEVCSQVEYDIQIGLFDDDPKATMEDPSASAPEASKQLTCKYKDCSKAAVSGDHCINHAVPEKEAEHEFAIPGLPPSFKKPLKPPTTKIFNSKNTSRMAALSKDMENIPKLPAAQKPKILPPKAPLSRPSLPPTAQNRPPVLQNLTSVLQPLINQNNIPPQPAFVALKEIAKPQIVYRPIQYDLAWLSRQVLHWKYEMFDNVSQFGPPSNLCILPLMKVPLNFSGYEEYFNVFFPLMLLNAFESVSVCLLHIYTPCTAMSWFRDADLNYQRHPKEDDLVFLVIPDTSSGMPGEEPETPSSFEYHTGHVSRFTRSQRTQMSKEQYTLCDVCIQTYGNLSGCRNQQVQCVVIGSLITTQRQYKALLQLQRNPLSRAILHPKFSDFLPRDNVTTSFHIIPSMKEYNFDQKYAIERTYAMVKQHPRLPRICMIHGPPGTGKSKTIVGLLYRILMESNNNVPDQNLNAKNKRNRVLVCAPSNAAIDDLMKKIILEFKEKCRDKSNTLGNCGDINLVRLGAEKMISSDVVKFSLDCQVNYRIQIHKHKEALDKQLDVLSRQRAMEKCNKNTVIKPIFPYSVPIMLTFDCKFRRRPQEVQRTIILESHVICCTLSTSGGFLLESAFRQLGQEPFSCVIVDEAGQCCEVENLIPLLHRCAKLVLVGDPEQLPPTVISVKAEELGYGQSLMSRFYKHFQNISPESPVMQLTTQYRMHPDICLFPSNYFYKRTLKTDRATEEVRCSSDWPFQPYMVFDVADGCERKERESFSNPQEIKVVVALIKLIKSKKKEFCFRNIGIITPYRAQKMMIIDQLKRDPGEVDTVDGFQGRQKDCIIVTCVRANSAQGSIGFLASRQRLNVTITRAKFSLFILGSLRTLMDNVDWNNLIQDAQRRGALIRTKQETYQRDVNRILKWKPVGQRAPLPPSSRMDDRGHTPRTPSPLDSNKPTRQAEQPQPQPPALPKAIDRRRDSLTSLPCLSAAPAQSSIPRSLERPKDPRLARWQNGANEPPGSHASSGLQPKPVLNREQAGNPYPPHPPSTMANRQPQCPLPVSVNMDHTTSHYKERYRIQHPIPEPDHEAKKRKIH